MKYEYILGVDPGAHGALAVLDAAGRLVVVDDMPAKKVKRGKRMVTEVDTERLATLTNSYGMHCTVAFVEKVGARPGQGVSSMFAFGRSVGQVEGALAVAGIPIVYVPPKKWRTDLQVLAGKTGSRTKASLAFPRDKAHFARVKDDGRADAALIALWGYKREREAA